VIAADIDLDAAEITAAAVRDAGGEAKAVACDVAQEAQVAALAEHADAAWGGADLIVNNAGVAVRGRWRRSRRATGSGSWASTCGG
jgi:NAD(P)-dependent dehydrogenase (short-subunit alcohol dehydrogenase family)